MTKKEFVTDLQLGKMLVHLKAFSEQESGHTVRCELVFLTVI